MSFDKIQSSAIKTIETEIAALEKLKGTINRDFSELISTLHHSSGRLVFTGIGKSAIIAQKIVATLNSTGTPSLFMHAADAIHGDLGMVLEDDIVILISNSGETPEIKVLLPIIKNGGNFTVAMVGSKSSFLGTNADHVLLIPVPKEACPNNLAPTSSTTAQLALGDAIAISLLTLRGFGTSDFAKLHPGGNLGKKLYLKVKDLCAENKAPKVYLSDDIGSVILEITNKRLGSTVVLDEKSKICGIITDGDIRRMLDKKTNLNALRAKDIMGKAPLTIDKNELAVNALSKLRSNMISQLVVTHDKKYFNIIHLHDLIREGLV